MQITSITQLEELNSKVNWQNFEKLTKRIFEENGYDAESEVLMLKTTKRQFDVVAKTNKITFLVECKKWKNLGNIRNAVKQHLERCKKYFREHPNESIQPILVVPFKATVQTHKNVPIVPLISLNSYLND